MAAPAEKNPREQDPRGRQPSSSYSSGGSGSDPASPPERELAEGIRREAGSALSAVARFRGRRPDVLTQAAAPEKEKVSITLDKALVDQIRAQFGGRALSTSINELLYAALAQERLRELVDEMEQEVGPVSPEAYERVLAQWFTED